MTATGLLSKLTVGAVGLLCKTFLKIGYCSSVTVNGIENLLAALQSEERNQGRGVVTISNHISTLDEPVVWGILPARCYFNSRMTRWTLGASDIMFTNPAFSSFFRNGQVLETFRGSGIFQPAVDTAAKKLNEGEWVHLFGEGKVNQPVIDGFPHLLRFKWGVGRILMEAVIPPVIIPMWLEGFDKLMPEGRPSPLKFFPRPGADLSITFGKPIDDDEIRTALGSLVRHHQTPVVPKSSHGGMADPGRPQEEQKSAEVASHAWLGDAAFRTDRQKITEVALQIASVRSAITTLVQRNVEALGREVMARRKYY
ncbi:acyltransferase-domain-containing protein [Sparassis latifolia]